MAYNLLFTNKIGVIILASGKSSRMGIPKMSLIFNEKHHFIEEIIAQYKKAGCKEIIVVINKQSYGLIEKKFSHLKKDCRIIVNSKEHSERFYSLQLGLKALQNTSNVFIHNVDNPFVNQTILQELVENKKYEFVAPSYNGKGGHPILLSKKVINSILNTKNHYPILSDFLKNFTKKTVAVPSDKILVNINTEEDYKKLFHK